MLAKMLTVAFTVGVVIATAPAQAQNQDVESKAQLCAACHGANGQPADPKTMPTIWGQQAAYIAKELHDYRSGDRENGVMAGIAKGLTQQDLRPLANYFAGKTWPAKQGGGAPGTMPAAMAQCQACHQAKFEGGLPAPRLAGLSYEYLVAQMKAFKTGTRTNNQDMPKVMEPLKDSDIDAMAKYLAAL